MEVDCIPFAKTGYFSTLICDYLATKEALNPFYNRFPTLENFEAQLKEKSANFTTTSRLALVDALKAQYNSHKVSNSTKENLNYLKENNTFTVVTGHQLNLFTGPLYFIYKIVSTVNLTLQLKKKYPNYNFVPVYWMATEDHDFDEINFFNLNGKKFQWNQDKKGAVGRLELNGLEDVFELLQQELGHVDLAKELAQLFEKAYLKKDNLTEATRYLVNSLFGEKGLVIVDGDDKALKSLLVPYIKKDIFENTSFNAVNDTIAKLQLASEDYPIQVNPREINYFYLKDGLRERLVERDGSFFVNDTAIQFTKNELLKEIENSPERFSPNVIARPIYQEVILPNLCYIGGGGELAYWLELKTSFEHLGVTFPMLLLRNSVLMVSEKEAKKMEGLDLSFEDLFLNQNQLINKKIRKISNIDIDFTPQKKLLETQFESLYKLAKMTDKSFLGAVKAQEVKQKKGLDNLEKRLLKAQKRKLKDHVVRLSSLQNTLFPNQSLQERQWNFSQIYLELGDEFIASLFENLNPLQQEFTILRY
ncbi:putative cysteine ligase BshC [Croceivirga lutea]|uniref:bacillithiol biosynthesis cysteine-adding enzyme BshC n=1 Tax=Croceivirga lutea TaxID=1775167 RepID=UPI00163A381D|nr:bacillithiol biosynthesis cysteine-adding enzyme BshC [Croceivirga lutea]GGG56380.1 putative cysteine ligase BshC [Croceivirga lutea]